MWVFTDRWKFCQVLVQLVVDLIPDSSGSILQFGRGFPTWYQIMGIYLNLIKKGEEFYYESFKALMAKYHEFSDTVYRYTSQNIHPRFILTSFAHIVWAIFLFYYT